MKWVENFWLILQISFIHVYKKWANLSAVNKQTQTPPPLQVVKKLVDMGVSGELSQLVAGCLWVRREEIRSQLVRDSYQFSHTHLNDFDWRLKVSDRQH